MQTLTHQIKVGINFFKLPIYALKLGYQGLACGLSVTIYLSPLEYAMLTICILPLRSPYLILHELRTPVSAPLHL